MTAADEQRVLQFASAAAAAGCPRDQVQNLLNGRVALSPRQLAMSAAARLCDRPDGPSEVGVGGARGGGKSYWLLAQMGIDDCQRVPGLKCLLLRKVGKAAIESLVDLSRQVLRNVKFRLTTGGVLTFDNGSRIITGHFNTARDIDKYLGLEYDVVGVEEATTLSKEKYSDIRTCNRSSVPGWRPRTYSTTNPGGVGHGWYKRRFIDPHKKGLETDTRFVFSLPDDNRFLNDSYVRTTLDTLAGWKKRAWRFGDWDIVAGQFFDTFSDRHHVRDFTVVGQLRPDGTRYKLKEADVAPAEWFAALDYGHTHYTVCLLACRDTQGRTYVVDEHAKRKWLVPNHAAAIKAMLDRFGVAPSQLRYFCAGADAFTKQHQGVAVSDTYRDEGLLLTPAFMDRIGGWAQVGSFLGDPDAGVAPRGLIHSRCAKLVESIPEMQHDPNDPEDVLKVDVEEDGSGGDDSCDALRYLLAFRAGRASMARIGGM